uniref:C2 domain-containing protein n=1 Tax=Ascaris lumbricoides TaxID=6252 RepID=A0A0M3ILD2_ASCLU
METLSVRRQKTTVFNQWYCCELPKQLFHTCALKIQFCHLNRYSQKTIIAEADYWIDENPIDKFTEYDIPLQMSKPDLGEIEVGLCYLPTSERLCVTIVQATNLRLLNDSFGSSSKTMVKIHLLCANRTRDKQRTQLVEGSEPQFHELHTFDVNRNELDESLLAFTLIEIHLLCANRTRDKQRTQLVEGSEPQFHELHTFDVNRNELDESLLAFTLIEILFIGERFRPYKSRALYTFSESANESGSGGEASTKKHRNFEIGRVVLASNFPGTEHTHWRRMLKEPRVKHTEIHKLNPC